MKKHAGVTQSLNPAVRAASFGGIAVLILSACVSTGPSFLESATTAGIDNAEQYSAVCAVAECSVDPLEERVQVNGRDRKPNLSDSLIGSFPYNLEFTYVSGNKYIHAKAVYASLSGWIHASKAAIYVGKEQVAILEQDVRTSIGYYNEYSNSSETIEKISGLLEPAVARKIASSNSGGITLRFYGNDGYVDQKIGGTVQLMAVVQAARIGGK